jgi:hypothetical protein
MYLCNRHSIVSIQFHATMVAQVQFVGKVIHSQRS